MLNINKKFILVLIIFTNLQAFARTVNCPDTNECIAGSKTYFLARPVHSNVATKMVAISDKIRYFDSNCFSCVFDIGFQYQQFFNTDKLTKYFFGKEKLSYGPVCNNSYDIFGQNLGTTGSGSLSFNPEIKNFIIYPDLWISLDKLFCGLWTRFNLPIINSHSNLNAVQKITLNGQSVPFTQGQVNFLSSGTQASLPGILQGMQTGSKFGIAPELNYARICNTKTFSVSALEFELGYDFIKHCRGNLGLGLRFVAPINTNSNNIISNNFFYPDVFARNWEIGLTLLSAFKIYQTPDEYKRLSLFFNAQATHLCYTKQKRFFNLKNKANKNNNLSYWLLLKQFDAQNNVIGLERTANVLSGDIKIGANLMADLALMIQYDHGPYSFALGWNFWGRTQESLKISSKKNSFKINENNYGILGDTVVDFATTKNNATIGNCGAVNPNPIFLTIDDIDFCSALHPKAYSHKLFGWIGYNFKKCKMEPFIALEGEIEIGHQNKAMNLWSVMFKGGIAF